MKRDPEQDWLTHCELCDGRHDPQKQTCAEFAYWLLNRFQAVGAEGSSSPAANLDEGAKLRQSAQSSPRVG